MALIEAGATMHMDTHSPGQAPQALRASAVPCAQGSFPGEDVSTSLPPPWKAASPPAGEPVLLPIHCFHWKLFCEV